MAELLVELLSEEIPARMQRQAAKDFARLVQERLKAAALDPAAIETYVTPRRIVLSASGVPAKQPDRTEERRGPRVGAPEKAIQGFLGANGLTSIDACEIREIKGAEFYFIVREIVGQQANAALPDIIAEAILALPWPKSMRWADTERRYVRPLTRVSAVFDGQKLDGAVDFGGSAGKKVFQAASIGHRFMSDGQDIPLTDIASFKAALLDAHVVLDPAERRARIEAGLAKVAAELGYVVQPDPGLLDEVTGLVEWPVVLAGAIDDAFMTVPPEALTTSMRSHQKYFALSDADGALAPAFAVVANIDSDDGGKRIVAGNERVLRARLSDARFFWDQDRKTPLADRVADLQKVVFHAKLGTVAERVLRMQTVAGALAADMSGADAETATMAAGLAKADLTTGMVGEFPELQGVMGRYYALEEAVQADVADAIRDHYAPQGPSDACPKAPVSVAVALAEKLDTLAGFFAIDEKPTGSRDPYALRRAALGVIRLVLENHLPLSLRHAFRTARDAYDNLGSDAASADIVADELLQFFADRLKAHLRGENVPHDQIAAVFALGDEDDLVRIVGRVEALGAFLASEDGGNLLIAYRRAANIAGIEAKKDGKAYDDAPDSALFATPEEQALSDALGNVRTGAASAIAEGRFADAMTALSGLRQPVDAFFEKVTVNADDSNLRANRLKLLSAIGVAMREVADFGQIEGQS